MFYIHTLLTFAVELLWKYSVMTAIWFGLQSSTVYGFSLQWTAVKYHIQWITAVQTRLQSIHCTSTAVSLQRLAVYEFCDSKNFKLKIGMVIDNIFRYCAIFMKKCQDVNENCEENCEMITLNLWMHVIIVISCNYSIISLFNISIKIWRQAQLK